MSDSDIMSFLTYQNAGGMNNDFTSVKSALKWDPIYYSRTANASYGIGLAAVILNDEAMGYMLMQMQLIYTMSIKIIPIWT